MRQAMIAVLAFALLAPAAAQGEAGHRARPSAAAHGREAAVRAEAEAFMAGYARDLLAADRAAIAGRYDRRGAWRVGGGQKSFERWTDLRDHYAGADWSPPASFAWDDLSYEAIGPDAVVVAGLFRWGISDRRTVIFSYTALLVRQGRELRIRLEDESRAPIPVAH